MLVITRRIGESLIINDKEMIIKVLGIKENEVSIGIEAAEGISILREELYNKIKDGKSEKTGERQCTIEKSKLLTSQKK